MWGSANDMRGKGFGGREDRYRRMENDFHDTF